MRVNSKTKRTLLAQSTTTESGLLRPKLTSVKGSRLSPFTSGFPFYIAHSTNSHVLQSYATTPHMEKSYEHVITCVARLLSASWMLSEVIHETNNSRRDFCSTEFLPSTEIQPRMLWLLGSRPRPLEAEAYISTPRKWSTPRNTARCEALQDAS